VRAGLSRMFSSGSLGPGFRRRVRLVTPEAPERPEDPFRRLVEQRFPVASERRDEASGPARTDVADRQERG